MNAWEQKVVDPFIPELSSLWVVSDADGVARNENILSLLNQKGFEVVVFEDPIEFRFEYENADRFQNGTSLILIFEPDASGYNKLPSDILANARKVDLNLNQIFPQLDRDVIRQVPVSYWQTLWTHSQKLRQSLNYRETAELVLRVCYRFVYELLDDESQLVHALIELHLGKEPAPQGLSGFVAEEIQKKGMAQGWALGQLLESSLVFWEFLQSCWCAFLKSQGVNADATESNTVVEAKHINFEQTKLRYYVDNLLDEGFLKHIEADADSSGKWWSIGIRSAEIPEAEAIQAVQSSILKRLPDADAGIESWRRFGLEYGKQVSTLFLNYSMEELSGFWNAVWNVVDERFQTWLRTAYPTFHNLAGNAPAMVHQIPRFLNAKQRNGKKVALLVLDGLSVAGWYTLRSGILKTLSARESISETTTFAWIPSLTPISRQAIFAGSPPHLFQETLKRTDKDAFRWKQYWTTQTSLLESRIEHLRINGDLADLKALEQVFERPNAVIGMTVNKPDDMMHGATMGWKGWHHQLSLWSQEAVLAKIVSRLLEEQYSIGITADHGNLEAVGIGKISDGTLAERRGERVRIYNDKILRDHAATKLGDSAWSDDGLPFVHDHWALFPKGRSAFTTDGQTIVAHGGTSIDEMMVPWVTIEKKEAGL